MSDPERNFVFVKECITHKPLIFFGFGVYFSSVLACEFWG